MGRLHSNQPTANSPLYVQNAKYWLHTLTKLSPLSGNHAHAHKVSGKFSLRVVVWTQFTGERIDVT